MSTLPNESTANWPNHARQSLLSDSQSVLDDQLGSPRSTVQGMGTKGVIVLETPYIDQEVPRDAWGKFMYYFKFFWTFFHGFAAGFGGLVFISLVVGDTSMTAGTRAWWWFLCCAGGCYTVYEASVERSKQEGTMRENRGAFPLYQCLSSDPIDKISSLYPPLHQVFNTMIITI
eukprot:TRINITY_DN1805_c0_g1_i1.p2 TRINITY_DN1805_c0_g1~~TRINITY_DN1805_c0_g1_i1.p2  ORF type:complete len:174 (+),score=23.64 TRINITY_DN1805_c0_g1_i1:49-570(+)